MKRAIWIALLLILLCGQAAAANEQLPPELRSASPEAASLLTDGSDGSFGLAEGAAAILKEALMQVREYIAAPLRSLVSIVVGVVVLGLLETLGGTYAARHANLVGALYITAVSAGDLHALIGLGRETVAEMSALSKTLIPALAAATATTGGITSASVRQVTTVFFSDLLVTAIDQLFLPLLYLYIALAAATAVLDNRAMENIASMIKKGMVWALSGLLAAFTAYLSISGAVAGATDAHAVRIAKTAVSTMVPVVGGILSEAADSVLGGAQVLRAMIGVFGALAILSLCLLPFLRLGIQYLLYQTAVLTAHAAGPQKLAKMLSMFANAFALVLAMTGASALLLLISLVSTLTVVAV